MIVLLHQYWALKKIINNKYIATIANVLILLYLHMKNKINILFILLILQLTNPKKA